MGSTMQHDERRCSAGRKDKQHHGCNRSCCTNAAVAIAEPWAAVQDAAVQRMLGRKA